MKIEIIETADGSHTLLVPELGERYHSWHGAIQESRHVFIHAGLKPFFSHGEATSLNILEIGLGTGLNALLTLIEMQNRPVSVHYTAIEAAPLEKNITEQLNYIEFLNAGEYQTVFNKLHACDWNDPVKLTEKFIVEKLHITLQNVVFTRQFELIYFDAFGPRVQPEMWTEEVFSKLFATMLPGACLVTYCAQGEVKRTLKRTGFTVETIPGPPGKREMVRAWRK